MLNYNDYLSSHRFQDGKCVRLTKGDFEQQTVYSRSPIEQAKAFEDKGFEFLHVVDLDRTIHKEKI